MKQNDYMNRSQVMQTADRKLMHYISSAAFHLRKLEEYQNYKGICENWQDIAWLYKRLAAADMMAAKTLISSLENRQLIDFWDWLVINYTLTWFGTPAEDR